MRGTGLSGLESFHIGLHVLLQRGELWWNLLRHLILVELETCSTDSDCGVDSRASVSPREK